MMSRFLAIFLSLVSAHAGMFSPGFIGGGAAFLNITCNGTLTTDGNFKVCDHTSTGSSTLVINSGSGTLRILVRGGGASGGGGGSGGGAGRMLDLTTGTYNSSSCTAGVCTVTVGAKGAAQGNGVSGQDGGASVFDVYSMPGGGFGVNSAIGTGHNGGSGGGGCCGAAGGVAQNGTGSNGLGNNGGGAAGAATLPGSGGGGSGGAGTDASGNSGAGGTGGNGGACTNSDILVSGVNVCYAGGGGGGTGGGGTAGTGGGGGASDGATSTAGVTVPAAACNQANSGSGGGGGGFNGAGGSGGAGCDGGVTVRWQFQ